MSPRRPLNFRHALLILLLLLIAWVFWKTSVVWLAAYLAVAFTVTLTWLADLVKDRFGWRYGWSLAAVVTVIVLLVAGVGLWMGPALIEQGAALTQRLPEAVEQGRGWLEQREWGATLLEQWNKFSQQMQSGSLLPKVTSYLGSAVGAAGGILAVIAITIFFAATPNLYVKGVMSLVPPGHVVRIRKVLRAIAVALRWWVLGRLISMTIVGVFTGLGLMLVDVPLPWVLGFLAGALSFVPNLGPIVAMVPGVLLAATEGPEKIFWAIGIYVGVQLIESNAITPIVERYAVSVPPALLLIVQLALGMLFGIMGLIVATPLMVAVIVSIQMLYVEDRLGRDVEVMGQHESKDD